MKLFKKESQVENFAKKHVGLVNDSVKKLKDLMNYFYQNDFDKVNEKVNELAEIEHKADIIRRQIEIQFYNGAFLPFDREDRIVLTELVDNVSDMAQETAYNISLSRIHFPEKGKSDFEKFLNQICKSVTTLKECIDSLDDNLDNAVSKAHEVEVMEEEADIMERKILKTLYQLYRENKIGILTLIELKNITMRLGNVVDRAEDASDRALIIAAKRRG